MVLVAVTRDEVAESTMLLAPVEVVEATEPRLSSSLEDFLLGRGGGGFRATGGGAGWLPIFEVATETEAFDCSGGLLIECCFTMTGRLVGTMG